MCRHGALCPGSLIFLTCPLHHRYQVTEDACIPHVGTFVQSMLTSSDWHHRDAAILAVGAIMEGPTDPQLGPFVAGVRDFCWCGEWGDLSPIAKGSLC